MKVLGILLCVQLVACQSNLKESIASGSSSSVASENSSSQMAIDSCTPDTVLGNAFANQTSNLQVLVKGSVVRLLADDTAGDRHQRFIISLQSGQTLLVAHNIDLAARVENLQTGTVVRIFGVYEWNGEGGVLHWTHRDPEKVHVDGWIEVGSVRYQ